MSIRFRVHHLLCVMAIAAALTACWRLVGLKAVIQLLLAILACATFSVGIKMKGNKSRGLSAVVSVILIHLFALLPTGLGDSVAMQLLSFFAVLSLSVLWSVSITTAMLFDDCSGRFLGGSSLIGFCSPVVLDLLDYIQFLVLTALGVEWSEWRPFRVVRDFIW